ncbi:Bug family tripartite tricarboxylate transporter substrate binding protein [Ancylobacter oerskovii]|uniref:Bug family tripartite tricarboxylate transporter substrate binding protein n=1 Tax=Ancylobacter oerskovii TaxID=459519 RepID=A0ABW4Z002_9HYPH|nr:tripartite tricarboxylate transporter substrate binding protein [Ancylobacter oerskovii]MBS7543834.1 tripartite tricarboxylate transporter substrate binding protein [Ancylobacter oerskovii]
MIRLLLAVSAGLALAGAASAQNFQPANPECIAPAAPGGGFDLTCRVTSQQLNELGIVKPTIRTTNMPGGIGAVAYNNIQARRPNDPNVIIAVSTGSWVNLAQGKFGRFTENDVRWLGAIGADYGVLAVRKDSPYKTLQDFVDALKKDPGSVTIGAGGTVGSQDWMKPALVAKAAGVDPRKMRYLSYEGGGEALAALLGGTIQAVPGDASEVQGQLEAGEIRVLATFSEERLPGVFANVPTAKEQGYDVQWPIVRGFYAPPKITDEQYAYWVDALKKLNADPKWQKVRTDQGLFAYDLVGPDFDAFAKQRTDAFRKLAAEVGLKTTGN